MFHIAIVCVIVVLLGYWYLRNPIELPPGPSQWSLFKLRFFSKNVKREEIVLEWGRKYKGLIVLQTIGRAPGYLVSSYELLKEMFVQNADYFSNRPNNLWLVNKLIRKKGITFNINSWKETRRFALRSMRDFGLGKQSLEERIQTEARNLAEQFRTKGDEAFDPKKEITFAVSNVICSITFGKRYQPDDTEFIEALENLEKFFNSRFMASPLNYLPFLRYLAFLDKQFDVSSYEQKVFAIRKFVRGEIMKHRETFDPDNIRDLVDLYLKAEMNGFQEAEAMDEENLFQTILDLFIAGTDTTTGTLRWILLRLINNHQVQKRCQIEIHKVIGKHRVPEYRERNSLPYTVATIQEAMRMDTVGFGTIQHVSDKSMSFGGYTIPQGAQVSGLTRGIMYDPQIWGDDADQFRPDRWLNEEGQVRIVPEFLPFGIGRRSCPGEQLAKTELFINTVTLLQNFTIQAEDPSKPPKVEGIAGTTYTPKPFKIVAVAVSDN